MKRLTTLLILVIGFSFCFTSSVFALDTPNVPAEYLTARDYVAEQPSWCASNPNSCKCGLHDAPVYIPVWLYDYQSTPVLEGYNVYVCRSDMCGGKTARVLLSYILRSPYKWLELSLSAPQSSPTNYMSCLSTGFYNISTNTWSSGTGTGRAMPDRRGTWSSTLMLSSLPISYYSTTARDFSGSYGFSTLNANTDYQFSNANWSPFVSVPVIGENNPDPVFPYNLDYFTPINSVGEFTRTSSTSPCKVDLLNGIQDYYDLICDDETSFFVDSDSGSVSPTYDESAIFIANINDPCASIMSVNYTLYDTDDNLLCISRVSDVPSSNRVPDIPLLSLIPPEADWGAFDFLKSPINSIITGLNSFITFGNNFSESFLNFFLPSPYVLKTLGITLKTKFTEKIDITGFSEFMKKIGQAMANKNNYTPPNITSTIMGVNVSLVDWSFVSDNISLIRGFLNGVLIFAYAFVIFNILKKSLDI